MNIKLIAILLAARAVSAFAQQEPLPACMNNGDDCNQQVYVLPVGTWALCRDGAPIPLCNGYVPGQSEQYGVFIAASAANVSNFRYVVTGTVNGGQSFQASGTVDRATNGPRTMVIIKTGGVFDAAPTVVITERVDRQSR